MKSIGFIAWLKRAWRGRLGATAPATHAEIYDTPYIEINGSLQAQNRAVRFTIEPMSASDGHQLRVRLYAENCVSTCGESDEIYSCLENRASTEVHILMGGTGRRIVATGRIVKAEMIAEAGKVTILRYEFDGAAHRVTRRFLRRVPDAVAA